MLRRLSRLFSKTNDDSSDVIHKDALHVIRDMPSLEQLAEEANIILESEYDYGSDAFERSDEHTPIFLIRTLYASCWCHYFACALRELTSWPIVRAIDSSNMTVHRLNRDFDGRLIDVFGHVTQESLCTRYGIQDLSITDDSAFQADKRLDDEYMADIMAAMWYLPYEPFLRMRPNIELWVKHGRIGQAGPWRINPPTV